MAGDDRDIGDETTAPTVSDGSIAVTGVDPSASEPLAELWIALARGQRDYGSHLEASANQQQVQEVIARYAASDSILVARPTTERDRGDPTSAVEAYTADTESDAIGFVMFRTQTNRYAVTRSRGLVENLYVVPDYRGRGVGSRLLAAAEARLHERGVEVVALESMAANEDARRFYRRRGYDPHRVEFEKSVGGDTTH